ncbi:type II secretion system protein GspD [Deinococcus reticulitermitis]|uniref:type II secretion system protein GspD n=1 Tax=Deinococcus reticulitermitis TaxID=856736 RepID=UPI001FE1CEFE|nr:secretin N-terminal domain-containing protein [Deinococcus reticulitermitis]
MIDQPAPIPVAQIVQRVFQLVNASAEEVKATLEGTLARDLSAQQENAPLATRTTTAIDANGNPTVVNVPATPTPAATSAAQAASELSGSAAQTTIIADKRTNTLIVRGTTEQVAQISELIPQLDQVVPQINVQVRIQEVTEKAVNALGLNWRANFGGFNVAVSGSSGIAASFNPTQSFLGFNIFPTLTALETQGLTKRIYDGNVSMQSGQRSLGAASRSQAQNASAGAAATIKSGGRLEINIPSVAGNIEKQIDYGVNFDFFDPQVAPDGTITLRVRGQVNTLNSTITPASIPNVLDFSNSEAQSTITFKTGQTVLMSGLLGKTETSNRGGVPFLSSLPVIGPAFGEKRTEKTETQLLVIITGTVVK